jgi:hypothetical protein
MLCNVAIGMDEHMAACPFRAYCNCTLVDNSFVESNIFEDDEDSESVDLDVVVVTGFNPISIQVIMIFI